MKFHMSKCRRDLGFKAMGGQAVTTTLREKWVGSERNEEIDGA